ncbi:MAG: GDSL-type esterase/lipase family protein [bacterium]
MNHKSQFINNLDINKSQTIVTYGTSLTAGGAWVEQLSDILNKRYPELCTIMNSGAGGMWSNWGVDNLDERVISKQPDTVFIEFSINDAFLQYETSVEQAKDNLNNMIDRIKDANPSAEVILMVMNPPTNEHLERRPNIVSYNLMYHDVAQERNLLIIDHYNAWKEILDNEPHHFFEYVPDGIHPNAAGCEKVITPAILKAIGIKYL